VEIGILDPPTPEPRVAEMPGAVQARHVRALALASASFGLGLAGHVQAGGHSGSSGALAFGAAFCALTAWSYAWRRLSGPAVAALLLANQLVMHAALALSPSTADRGPAAAGSCHDAPAAAGRAAEHATASLLPSGWMLCAHVVASVLAAVVIVAVEAVWLGVVALAAWIARVARVAFAAPPLPLPFRAVVRAATPSWTSRPVGARPGRGPPHLRIAS
jgi:hypothetical protein